MSPGSEEHGGGALLNVFPFKLMERVVDWMESQSVDCGGLKQIINYSVFLL